MIQVGDMVQHRDDPNSVPCEVLEVKDLGHGEGYERVKIVLFGILTRYYAMNELVIARSSGYSTQEIQHHLDRS